MKTFMKNHSTARGLWFPTVALLLSASLTGCGETIDNFNSEAICGDYCSKKFDCDDQEPTSNDTDVCVNNCRNSIEDDCGNDNQQDANDKIAECVDLSCDGFWTCMVFEAAPECFGFVN